MNSRAHKKMDGVRWEDEIDLDDSDLCNISSLPFLRPCSQSQPRPHKSPSPPPPEKDPPTVPLRRIIPGPAGAVQAAMHRKVLSLRPLAEKGACSASFGVVDDDDIDSDFNLGPWLSALYFVGFGTSSLQQHSPIISIRSCRSPIRVDQVLGIVNSCRPNGSGGLFITLKDPTGKIDASVHHKVLNDRAFSNGELAVGCVLVLKQVVLFPIRGTSYLNITLQNMVKLFPKDCESPPTSSLRRYIANGKCNEGKGNETRPIVAVGRKCTQVVEKLDTNGSENPVNLDLNVTDRETLAWQIVSKQTMQHDPSRNMIKRAKVDRYLDGSVRDSRFTYRHGSSSANICNQLEEERSTSMTLESKGSSYGNTKIDPYRTDNNGKVCSERNVGLSIRSCNPVNTAHMMTPNNTPRTGSEIGKGCAGATKLTNTRTVEGERPESSSASLPTSSPCDLATTLRTVKHDAIIIEPKVVTSKASASEWTDEQISELFSDYSDADEMNKFLL